MGYAAGVFKRLFMKLDAVDLDDVRDETLFVLFVPTFVVAVLVFAGLPLLWALVPAVLIEAGHLWNSGFGG